MLRFRGFRANFKISTGKQSGLDNFDETPGISLTGAYRINKDELLGNIDFPSPSKQITPSMVKLPASQSGPSLNTSKTANNLAKQQNNISGGQSTPNISTSVTETPPRNQTKEQKKLEKQQQKQLEEQKKQEKKDAKAKEKAEKLRKEREKQNAKQTSPQPQPQNIPQLQELQQTTLKSQEVPQRQKRKKDKAEKQLRPQSTPQIQSLPQSTPQTRSSSQSTPQSQSLPQSTPQQQTLLLSTPQPKSRAPNTPQQQTLLQSTPQSQSRPVTTPQPQSRKKQAPQPQSTPQLAIRSGRPEYSTNTLESSISRSSGPPPYTPQDDHNEMNDSGNITFKVDSSWDMINEHRQQINRPKVKGLPKQTHLDLNYNSGSTTGNVDMSDA